MPGETVDKSFPSLHKYMIACIEALGFKLREKSDDETGVCNGYSMTVINYFSHNRLNQHEEFVKELNQYREKNPNVLLEHLKSIHQKCIDNQDNIDESPLTEEEKKLAPLRCFLENIAFCQSPGEYIQ